MIAIQSTGATLVPSALSKASTNEGASDGADAVDNVVAARRVADRLIGWAVVISLGMAGVQALAMPLLLPLFTPLAEVRAAVIQPARISALVQVNARWEIEHLGAYAPYALTLCHNARACCCRSRLLRLTVPCHALLSVTTHHPRTLASSSPTVSSSPGRAS